ncbi:MAG: DOPA 4,5-dioxygenase family protein [Beijerinckiaceae bacterium]
MTDEPKTAQTMPGFHAHVYFGPETVQKAREICSRCSDIFGIQMGRVHEKPVGPHPDFSCQLTIPPEKVGDVLSWLSRNRDGLVVFSHPRTDNALKDHTDHAIWMGAVRPLVLDNLG